MFIVITLLFFRFGTSTDFYTVFGFTFSQTFCKIYISTVISTLNRKIIGWKRAELLLCICRDIIIFSSIELYLLKYSDYCLHLHCYIQKILADMSFGLLQVFHGELRSLQRTLNWMLFLNSRHILFKFF